MAPFAETPIMYIRDTSPVEVFKEPDLLDGWWTSGYLYSLERRAIFSKTWICIAHQSRFNRPGDYITLEIAGFPILIILGKDHIARVFHNVCRHRAYTITKKPAGSSLVLGCRYHGWSYDTKGNLVKAPQFDGIEGFDKSENSLFKIHTCTDRAGFIHINLEAGELVHAPNLEDLISFTAKHGISAECKWLTGWVVDGAFNWKSIGLNYRHNNSAGASDRTGIGTVSTPAAGSSIMDFIRSMFRRHSFETDDFQTFLTTEGTTIVAFPKIKMWATMTALPVSAVQTTIRCDIFGNVDASLSAADEATLKNFFDSHIEALEHHYEATKFIRFEGIPEQLPVLNAHLRLERKLGYEIFPSKRNEGNSEKFCKAEKLCNDLNMLNKVDKATRPARVDSMNGMLEW